jgi:hypothetical protein
MKLAATSRTATSLSRGLVAFDGGLSRCPALGKEDEEGGEKGQGDGNQLMGYCHYDYGVAADQIFSGLNSSRLDPPFQIISFEWIWILISCDIPRRPFQQSLLTITWRVPYENQEWPL